MVMMEKASCMIIVVNIRKTCRILRVRIMFAQCSSSRSSGSILPIASRKNSNWAVNVVVVVVVFLSKDDGRQSL